MNLLQLFVVCLVAVCLKAFVCEGLLVGTSVTAGACLALWVLFRKQ